MLTERFQVLMTRAQRRRLEAEARQRGTSVGAVIREAVDARAGRAPLVERLRVMSEIRALRGGRYVPVERLERIVDEEREKLLKRLKRRKRR